MCPKIITVLSKHRSAIGVIPALPGTPPIFTWGVSRVYCRYNREHIKASSHQWVSCAMPHTYFHSCPFLLCFLWTGISWLIQSCFGLNFPVLPIICWILNKVLDLLILNRFWISPSFNDILKIITCSSRYWQLGQWAPCYLASTWITIRHLHPNYSLAEHESNTSWRESLYILGSGLSIQVFTAWSVLCCYCAVICAFWHSWPESLFLNHFIMMLCTTIHTYSN